MQPIKQFKVSKHYKQIEQTKQHEEEKKTEIDLEHSTSRKHEKQ